MEIIRGLRSVFGELNGNDRIINKSSWPPRSAYLNPYGCYLWGNLKSVIYAKNPHDLEALKQNIREAIYNIQKSELNKFSEICLKESRHFSQQKTDILNIFWILIIILIDIFD
jgi:hypothetical protein